MLRIALSMATMATDNSALPGALATLRSLLASIDDGSAVPELVAARTLLQSVT